MRTPLSLYLPSPPNNMQALVKEYVEELSFDKLPKLMTFFRDLLTGKGPVVIYGHCEVSEGLQCNLYH